MISKNDILQFVKHVHRRGQGIPDRRAMHPRREWLIGLLVFALITAAGLVVSLGTFDYYQALNKRTYSVDITIPEYDQALAETVLAAMAARDDTYADLLNRVVIATSPVATSTVASSTPGDILTGSTTTAQIEVAAEEEIE